MGTRSMRERGTQRRQGGGRRAPWLVAGCLAVVAVIVAVIAAQEDAPRGHDENFSAFGLDDDPFLGDPDPPVVLVGYESPHCSSCQYFHNNLLPGLKERYIAPGDVVYFYIQGTIGGDLDSSIAQECVYEQGGNTAFWNLTDRLYGRDHTYTSPDWHAWLDDSAADHGIDAEPLQACFDERATEDRVRADLDVGRRQGARGTPTFWAFGGGEAVPIGSMSDVEDRLLRLIGSSEP